jgi:plasmid stabilization system protein ParE
MKYQIIYHTDAQYEIIQVKKWYKEQQNGLERRFVISLKETINFILDNPLSFEVKYRNTRVAFTKTFPFGIHYLFDNNKIILLTILHTSKNPIV